ncbi:MAG: hypothetical protein AABX85_01625 [Nanoarchaeota archaeon]
MKNMGGILKLWKDIFGNWKYLSFLFLFVLFFYVFNVFVSNAGNLWYTYIQNGFSKMISLSFISILTFWRTILPSSFITMLIIGLLTGVLINIMIYNFNSIRNNRVKLGLASSIGFFLGVFTPGCAACGLGLAGLLGLTASLASLPFQGREISLLAIILISFSIVKTSHNLVSEKTCVINTQKTERRFN